MTVQDSYNTLGLPQGADLDAVKAAFRRLAFETHPDLHPEAGAQAFQSINAAYLTLRAHLEGGTAAGRSAGTPTGPGGADRQSAAGAYARQQKPWSFWRPGDAKAGPKDGPAASGGQAQAGDPSAKAAAGPRPAGGKRPRPEPDAEAARGQARRTSASSASAASAGAGRPRWSRDAFESWLRGAPGEGTKKSTPAKDAAWPKRSASSATARPGHGASAGKSGPKPSGAGPSGPRRTGPEAADRPWFERREDVLRDVLQDPYARQVFEDIYAQVLAGGRPHAPTIPQPSAAAKDSPGMLGRIGSWLRGQLDVEETIRLPASQLVPGRSLRITIDPGMFGASRTVDVRLPADFRPGRPIRLRGLGRSLGGRKGDLYLLVLPREPGGPDPTTPDPGDAA